ncbi:phage tail tip lysozyme [Lentilactobacillus parabuchneri]|uniref:phage tail tip lysozyme n=1 Tax=Lentilactobacillus parabuchneri TaxID=152331 RepID=UPI0031D7F69B
MKKTAKLWIIGSAVGLLIAILGFLLLTAALGGGGNEGSPCEEGGDVGNIGTNASQTEIAQYMFKFFKSKGMDDAHAAAVIGYADAESGGLVPSVRQRGNQSEAETGWGLFQVTPIDRLKNFAKQKGIDWKGVQVQLEYAWTELHHAVASDGTVTNGGPDWIDIFHHGVSISEWWKMDDVSDLAGLYTDNFGRGATSHMAHNDPHEVNARKWYAKLAGSTPDSSGGQIDGDNVSTDGGGDCGTGGGDAGGAKAMGDKLSYYDDLAPWLSKWLNQSPYNFGGAPTNLDNDSTAKGVGTDCSGFVGWALGHIGIHVSGRPTTYSLVGSDVSLIDEKEAKAGDLVFFGSTNAPHHVGVYIGGGYMIDDQDRGIVKEEVWPEHHVYGHLKGNLIPQKYR